MGAGYSAAGCTAIDRVRRAVVRPTPRRPPRPPLVAEPSALTQFRLAITPSSHLTCRDGGTTFSAPQRLFGQRRVAAPGQEDLTRDQARRLFRDFIRNFRRDGIFIYRDALRQNYENRAYCLEVELGDLRTGPAEALHDYVLKSPNEYLPMVSGREEEKSRKARDAFSLG